MNYLAILVYSLCVAFSAGANNTVNDEEPNFIVKYGQWEVYTQMEEGEKACFIVSTPIEKAGNYKRRGHSYLWVRSINNDVDEVSLTTGYRFKSGTSPKLAIHNNTSLEPAKRNELLEQARSGNCTTGQKQNYTYDLTEEEQAWVRDSSLDQELVKNMRAQYYAAVTALSQKDTCSTDIYSLIGFTKAYQKMKDLCK